jgi:hypothetical protein
MIDTSRFPFQGTKVNIIVGSHVWAEEPEIAWVDGEVVKINGEEAEIQATNGKKVTYHGLGFHMLLLIDRFRPLTLFLALSLIPSVVIALFHCLDHRKFVEIIPERYGGSCWWG